MILGALWFSKDKPTMTAYLKHLMTSINELSYEGTCTELVLFHIILGGGGGGGGTLILSMDHCICHMLEVVVYNEIP